MTFKIANISVSSLCLLVSLSCYAQDEVAGVGKWPSRLRARVSLCVPCWIDIACIDARSEGEEAPNPPPVPRKASVPTLFHVSEPSLLRRSSRLRPKTPKTTSMCPTLPPINKEEPTGDKS